jgi:Zn-dependent membrane protease YugP
MLAKAVTVTRHEVGQPVLRESSMTVLVLRKEIMVVPLAKTA